MANPIEVIKRIRAFEEGWGDFIQNGPSDGLPGYVRDKYRERCDQFANLPGWARALSKPVAGSLARACKPYWDDQGRDGPVSDIPFSGGQCNSDGGGYQIVVEVTTTTGSIVTFPRRARGPIGGVRLTQLSTQGIAEVFSSDLTGNGNCNISLPDRGGAWRSLQTQSNNFSPAGGATIRMLSVTPCPNQPNDCGDPEFELEPGTNPPVDPGPTPGPEPTDDPRNPFGPPLIPIPPFNDPVYGPLPIFGDPDPEPSGGGGSPSGGDGLPGSPDAIADSAGGAAGGEDGEDVDFGEPPEGSIWVGALVQATVDSRLGNIPGTGPEQTVYPTVIGNASLIYTGGRGTNERLESASTLLARATTALVLTGCRVQAQPGVNLTVRPISALTCPENPCEEQDG